MTRAAISELSRGLERRPRRPAHRDDPAWEGRFAYRNGMYDLTVPANGRTRSVARGPAEFALVVEEPVILLGYRFGESSAWSVARFERGDSFRHEPLPPADCLERGLVSVLIEGREAGPLRNLTLSLDFTRALNDAVRELVRTSHDSHDESRTLERLHRRSPAAGALIARASVRSVGSP